ncbi:hypothetical protein HAX54_008709 [Datura stramonium]|uniref:F-box associated domain-containing protein n=1 Tax=Datura stramonium TaxID=4076 RepID=A0ABS8RXF3_DATST|nr:hypothetical protein [Datura stramonium]
MNFHDSKTPHPQLEIVSDKRDPHARILALEIHPSVIGAFPLNKESPVEAFHLIKWSAKEKIDVLDWNKVLNMTVFLLKSSTLNEEIVVTCPKVSEEGLVTWSYPQSDFGKLRYKTCSWDWVEDVLSHNKEVLDCVKVYDVIFTSLFTYDINENVLRAFCELWLSMTNTICVGIGELSISLRDMHMIGGLPVQGAFYDEVVPSAQELTQEDQQEKSFFV